MNINTYLNDLSMQVQNACDWNDVFDNTMACLQLFSQMKQSQNNSVTILIDSQIFTRVVIQPKSLFTNLLNKDKERKLKFMSIYKKAENKLMFLNTPATYLVNNIDVSNSVVADSYESQKNNNTTFLINFTPIYPSNTVEVVKKGEGSQFVYSYDSKQKLTEELQKLKLLPKFYDKKSKVRPNESLTILADTTLFTPTKFGNRKNRLYRRNDKEDELWCLDRFHTGNSIHLEVFSESSKTQIAVSCHDKIDFFRELTDSEKKRTLKMDPMP